MNEYEIIETSIDVRNIQAIEKFEATIKPPGAFVIGKNGKGKSTFLAILGYALGAHIDFEATDGKTDGDFTVRIKTKDGNQWITGFQVDAKGKEKHYLIQPGIAKIEGKANVRSTLKSIWNYQWQTFQEFLPLTKTAEGKRKITAMLIDAMPEAFIATYRANIALSDPKVGTTYAKRTEANKALEIAQAVHDAIDANSEELLKKVSDAYESLYVSLTGITTEEFINSFGMIAEDVMIKINDYKSKQTDIEKKATKATEIEELKKKIKEYDDEIIKARNDNKEILRLYCPVLGVEFTEDDILVDGRTMDKMANSERFVMYCKIMEKSNKLPIILLDEVDGLDNDKINTTIKLAKDNGALLIMTRKQENSPLTIQQLNFDIDENNSKDS